MSEIGHNSGDVLTNAAQGRLKSFIDRIETLDEQKDDLLADMKEVYSEAKGEGFDAAAIRKLVSLRKKDKHKVAEQKAILELYASAIGCLDLV